MGTTTPRVALSVSLAAGRVLAGAGSATAAPPASAGMRLATSLTPAEEVALWSVLPTPQVRPTSA